MTPNPNIIADVVRDARNVLNDSPCAFCAFPAVLANILPMPPFILRKEDASRNLRKTLGKPKDPVVNR